MEVSYTHANPRSGQESYYIKFHDPLEGDTMCILVDSGTNVSVSQDLGDDEHLGGILLTHAHGDHYATLASNIVDGAEVYTSPDTARVLETILDETGKHDDIGNSDRVTDAITSVTDWTRLWGAVDVRPIPAGHCPGAVGFVIRFESDGQTNHILATGDFTFDSVAGNAGMTASLPFDIDAMFMNASVTSAEEPSFRETLDETLETIFERTRAGSETLVTTSGLAGVHYAFLLGHLTERTGRNVTVTIAGHLAKLYSDLGYDVPNVETRPVYDDPSTLISAGDVCIAGPCVPARNTSKRVFDQIRDNPGATLVQVLSGGRHDPVDSAKCSVYEYHYKAHPTQAEIDEFVEDILPRDLIVEHGRTNVYGDRYNHTITWSNRDYDEYTIYEDGYWCSPHWIDDSVDESIRANHHRKRKEKFVPDDRSDIECPPVVRGGVASLETEGIELDRYPPSQPTSDSTTGRTPEIETDGNGAVGVAPAPDSESPDPSPNTEQTDEETVPDDSEALGRLERELREIKDRLDVPEAVGTVVDFHDGTIAIKIDSAEVDGLEHGDDVRVGFLDSDTD